MGWRSLAVPRRHFWGCCCLDIDAMKWRYFKLMTRGQRFQAAIRQRKEGRGDDMIEFCESLSQAQLIIVKEEVVG